MDETKIPTDSKLVQLVNDTLEEDHYPARATSMSAMSGGLCHQNRLVQMSDESQLVLRWLYAGDHPIPARRDDHIFGGKISIFREAKVLELARTAGLPASKVIVVADKGERGKILLVEKVNGVHFRDYLEKHNHSLESFLRGLNHLGATMAKAHSVHFDSFGAIQPEGIIPGVKRYGEYLEKIMNRHFTDHLDIVQRYFNPPELKEVFNYLKKVIHYANNDLMHDHVKPSFVLYDQHARNFFVHPETGVPTGFFDLEYGQSAHSNLEFGSLGVQLFGFYSAEYAKPAREAFMQGYVESHGPTEVENPMLETIHTVNHIFSAVKSYDGFNDGIRNDWSKAFAKMILGIVREEKVNCYDAFTDLIRSVTKQPVRPN